MKDRIILDLCGGTGSWSKPYKDAGYDVRLVTLPDNDVRTYQVPENVYGILAAPPCTQFSFARTKAKIRRDFDAGMATVLACLNSVWKIQAQIKNQAQKRPPLKFWVLENPRGMLNWFLGHPVMEFNPYDFGDGYKKRTCLWGYFNRPIPIKIKGAFHSLNPKVMVKFDHLASRDIHPEYLKKLTRQARRAITPKGFAKAFFEANP